MVGMNFIGDLTGDSGVCEGARLTLQAIEQQGIPVSYIQKAYNIPRQPDLHTQYADLSTEACHPINLLYYNQTDAAHEKQQLRHLTDDTYTIAYWVWELMTLPDLALDAFDLVDEIWTASHFCKTIYQQYTDKPVNVIPHPIHIPRTMVPDREQFGIPINRLVFIFSFNVSSVYARKNPLAIIDAFQRAFDGLSPAQMPVLVIKTQQLEHYPLVRQVLTNRLAIIDGILIDGSLSRDEMYALLSSCDVYVSLHRSEGFGLGMAEAMYLGKPVIATAYSGNMDYMTHDNSCLVDYKLRRVLSDDHRYSPKDIHIFPPDGQWADPDINHAAYYMQQLYADPSLRQAIGDNAAQFIRDYCSFEQVGSRISQRLHQLNAINLRDVVQSRTKTQAQTEIKPATQIEHPSPSEVDITYTNDGVFQSKIMEWQALRVKGDMRSVENPILRRIPLLGFLYRTWYRIRHLGTLLAVQTQLIDLLSAKHHEHTVHIQQLADQNRDLQSVLTELNYSHDTQRAYINQVSEDLQKLKNEAEQRYVDSSNNLSIEVSRWQFLQEQTIRNVQDYIQLEKNQTDETISRLKDRQNAHKNTILDQIESLAGLLQDNDQTLSQQLHDYISQTDDVLRIITSRQRYLDHQATHKARQAPYAGLLQIMKAIESLYDNVAQAPTIDVSIQGVPHADDLAQVFDYWGERIQIVAPAVQYHFDFTSNWNRLSVFENASNKIKRGGLFVLITLPQHTPLPDITSLELVTREQLTVGNRALMVYVSRNLREEDIYGN